MAAAIQTRFDCVWCREDNLHNNPRSLQSHSSDVVHAASQVSSGGSKMNKIFQTLWSNQQGQDIAEYAVMLAVILVIVVGTIRLVGSNANKVFSSVASSVQ